MCLPVSSLLVPVGVSSCWAPVAVSSEAGGRGSGCRPLQDQQHQELLLQKQVHGSVHIYESVDEAGSLAEGGRSSWWEWWSHGKKRDTEGHTSGMEQLHQRLL
jgi:hypothetical protein